MSAQKEEVPIREVVAENSVDEVQAYCARARTQSPSEAVEGVCATSCMPCVQP